MMNQQELTRTVLRNPLHILSFGFGSGLLPKAPGTWGTLMAIPLWFCLSFLSPYSYILVVVIACLIGIGLCHYSAKKLGVHDHPGIVWDEFCGFWIAMIALEPTLINVLLAFVLFRVFDILKPWPISWLDKKVHGGFGIMIDDILAGLFALGMIHAGYWVLATL